MMKSTLVLLLLYRFFLSGINCSTGTLKDEKIKHKWIKLAKPLNKTKPIDEKHGLSFYDTYSAGGDQSSDLKQLKFEPQTYSCYQCDGCDLNSGDTEHFIVVGCHECVTIYTEEESPNRQCNHKPYSQCESAFDIRCCKGDLCNSCQSYVLTYRNKILIVYLIFMIITINNSTL
ncbi:unnamed protein product [Trichobilharzia szidati]|nr:unnamed protein product [Trichobilharzia szidati]